MTHQCARIVLPLGQAVKPDDPHCEGRSEHKLNNDELKNNFKTLKGIAKIEQK
jgi:hypothetical protein